MENATVDPGTNTLENQNDLSGNVSDADEGTNQLSPAKLSIRRSRQTLMRSKASIISTFNTHISPAINQVSLPGRRSTILQDSALVYNKISSKLSPPGTEVLQWREARNKRIAVQQKRESEKRESELREHAEREERRRSIRHRLVRKQEATAASYTKRQDELRTQQELEYHKTIRRVGRLELFGWEREKRDKLDWEIASQDKANAEEAELQRQLRDMKQKAAEQLAAQLAAETEDHNAAMQMAHSLALWKEEKEGTSTENAKRQKPSESVTDTHVLICFQDVCPNKDVPYHVIDDLVKYIARFPMAKDFYRKFPQSFSGAIHTVEGFRLGKAGMVAFSKCLSAGAYSDVKVLKLGWNSLRYQGTCSLAGALEAGSCTELTTLQLQSNHIGDDSIRVLVDALQSNKSIPVSVINLDNNLIGDKGATCLAGLVYKGGLPSISKLSLRGNRIHYSGAKTLLQMGTACRSRFANCGIGHKPPFNKIYRRYLEAIVLTGNPITIQEIEKLQLLYPGVTKL